MNKPQQLNDINRLQIEVESLQLANASLEQQLIADAEYTTDIMRLLEQQKNELAGVNQRLKDQAEFIQRVMDTTNALVIVLDPEGRLRQVNRLCTERLIDSNMSIEGAVLDNWLHPEEQESLLDHLPELPWKIISPFYELLRRHGFYSREHRIKERNGSYSHYLLEASMLYNPQGKNEGAVVSATDITPIKKQQDLLQRSEKLLKEAQHIAQLGHWELEIPTGKMTYSEEVGRILELDSSKAFQSIGEFLQSVHPDDRIALEATYKSSLSSTEPYSSEYRLLFNDGRIKWIQNRLVTYFNHDGNAVRTIGTMQDITSKYLAEEQLRLAACVFENSQNGILITDADAKIIKVNRVFCEITGYTANAVLGRKPSLLRSGHHDNNFYIQLWSELKKSGEWQGEIWNRRKNGELYQELLSISAIYDKNGAVQQYVGIFTDLTEQRRLEEQLRQSQKLEAIGTLVGGIAHDFNNTLAAIQGNVDLARLFVADSQAVSSKLDDIERLGEHSAEIIQQLLTFSRKRLVKMAPISLNLLFSQQQRIVKSFIPENIEFNLQLCEEPLTVMGDMPQLQQVLLNLFNNSRDALVGCVVPQIDCRCKFFEADSEFLKKHPELETHRLAHILVRDNGDGISEEDLPHIFEPFFTTKEVGKGTGLGMSMVYGSMQTHRGVIEVESIKQQGTSVHLYLPLVDAVEQPMRNNEKTEHSPSDDLTILLVDDNENVRETYSEALKSQGYNVVTAYDGQNAIECFEQLGQSIDLVVSDIVMPRMGGFQAIVQMQEKRPDLPVIFITGYDPETNVPLELRDKCLVICKPFSLRSLIDLIQEVLVDRKQL